MAIPFKNPSPPHAYTASVEKTRITKHFTKREVPKSSANNLLLVKVRVRVVDTTGGATPVRWAGF